MAVSNLVWSAWLRVPAFWLIVGACVAGFARVVPWLDFTILTEAAGRGLAGDLDALSRKEFAFALACLIGAVGVGLLVAFSLLHVVALRLSLWLLRRRIAAQPDMASFRENYDGVRQAIEADPLVGHAWSEFDKTLIRRPDDAVVRSTARPQAFFSINTAREHLYGLKIIGSVPGYFVGVGLLLTFIGLVLALNKAAAAVSGADASAMQGATRELLQVATFKFATSIAGLGMSILLSFAFRSYVIVIEAGFQRFCAAVESRLRYQSAQDVAVETRELVAEEVAQLKLINSTDFFARMGEQLTPKISQAMSQAMSPVTESINVAVDRLADNSQSGMAELLERFTDGVQSGAGTELRELATTLKDMQAAMLRAQQGISGSGEDFGRRMSEAAENLNRLIAEAGARLDDSSDRSRAALADIVGALRETFERANARVEEQLGTSAEAASGRLEEVMARVLQRLEAQVDGFRGGLNDFQTGLGGQLEDTKNKMAAVQADAADAVGRASVEAARALKEGLGDVVARIESGFADFITALKASEVTLSAQANAIRGAADQSRLVADAFQQTAQDVRMASAPLAQSSERMAGATVRLSDNVEKSVATLEASQAAARELAAALRDQVAQLTRTWTEYAARFEKVDDDLARAVAELGEATARQAQRVVEHVAQVDQNFAKAIDGLNPTLNFIRENTEDFGEAVKDLSLALRPRAAE